MSASQRGVAIVVGIVAIVAVTFLLVRSGGAGIGQGPEPSTTATAETEPSATAEPSGEASPSTDPSAPTDEEALAIFAEIEEQVITIRGLEAADIGPPDIITRAELADELERLFEEEYRPRSRSATTSPSARTGCWSPGRTSPSFSSSSSATRCSASTTTSKADGGRDRCRTRRRGPGDLRA